MLKVILKQSIFAVIILSLVSCSEGLYDYFAINDEVPYISEPNVKSFEIENAIIIEWDEDIGADEYILYRDIFTNGSFTNVVYRGIKLDYTDYNVNSENKYYYKLAKKRENKTFDKSNYLMGVASSIRKDDYEDNNSRENASALSEVTDANIYYYKDAFCNTLEDKDWYFVEIEGGWSLTISIGELDTGNLNNGDIYINIEEGVLDEVSNEETFTIDNFFNEKKTMYFQISINKSQFLGSPDAIGGKIGSYRIIKVVLAPNE